MGLPASPSSDILWQPAAAALVSASAGLLNATKKPQPPQRHDLIRSLSKTGVPRSDHRLARTHPLKQSQIG
jgi:hypothetical protein